MGASAVYNPLQANPTVPMAPPPQLLTQPVQQTTQMLMPPSSGAAAGQQLNAAAILPPSPVSPNTPQPGPQVPPVGFPSTGSPVHDMLLAALKVNPNAQLGDIVKASPQLGSIAPATLQQAYGDAKAIHAKLNEQAYLHNQNMQRNIPPMLNDAAQLGTRMGGDPSADAGLEKIPATGQMPPQALLPTVGQQNLRPITSANIPAVPPSIPPTVAPQLNQQFTGLRPPITQNANIPMGSTQNPGQVQNPVTSNVPGVSNQSFNGVSAPPPGTPHSTVPPGAAPPASKSTPWWEKALQGIGQGLHAAAPYIPLAAGALIGGKNAAVGASALNGWSQGQQQSRAQQQQQVENQRQSQQDANAKAQQQTENMQKNRELDIAADKVNAPKQFSDSMKGIPDGAAALALYDKAYPDDQMHLRDQFIDTATGNPKQTNPYWSGSQATAGQALSHADRVATVTAGEDSKASIARGKLESALSVTPDPQRRAQLINDFNNAPDGKGSTFGKIQYFPQESENHGVSYYGADAIKAAQLKALADGDLEKFASIAHMKVEDAAIPKRLAIDQGHLTLAQNQWAVNNTNPTSPYYGTPKPGTVQEVQKTIDTWANKANSASKSANELSEKADNQAKDIQTAVAKARSAWVGTPQDPNAPFKYGDWAKGPGADLIDKLNRTHTMTLQANQETLDANSRVKNLTDALTKPTSRSQAFANGRTGPIQSNSAKQVYNPTDSKTIGGITKPVAEWRAEYTAQTGKQPPF